MNKLIWIYVVIVLICIVSPIKAFAEINLDKIIQIESSGNPLAWNKKEDARGLCQIRKDALTEWNQSHKHYTMDDLFNPDINKMIAKWYLDIRIPQMLKYYHKPITTRNIIIAYNAGINYVARNKKIPLRTTEYLKKYKEASNV